jgi:hypothetical protein
VGTPAASRTWLWRVGGPGSLFVLIADPYYSTRTIDGISAAVLAVMVPLILSDASLKSGHFNLAQGLVGSGVGIGAAITTTSSAMSAIISVVARPSRPWRPSQSADLRRFRS